MIPLPTPPHRHAAVDEQEVVRQLSLLDPCSAWRADLADAGLTEPMDESLADQWLLWLEIATVFDRLRSLPVSARAGYARSTSGLWQRAEQVTGAGRFARVGAVMAAWEGAAPALEGYRELLWAVEQGEAEGAVKVSYNALQALSARLPERDLRRGYAVAHMGRVLRTVGLNDHSQLAFERADRIAADASDQWLRVRVQLGLGVLHHTRGNYPAAREIFGEALRGAHPHVELLCGAHLGLVTVARAAKDYSLALEHGWHALQYACGVASAEVEALTILAGLSLEVGEFTAALRSCQLAMSKSPGSRMRTELLRYIVHASLRMGDEVGVRTHLQALISAVERTPNPWQEAQGRYVLGEVFNRWGEQGLAARYLEQMTAIATQHGYKELLFVAEETFMQRSAANHSRTAATGGTGRAERNTVLTDDSQSVIDQLCCLSTS